MQKRHWFFDFVALVVVGSIILYLYMGGNLRTSILKSTSPGQQETTVDDCGKLSEDAANDCFQRLAVREKDAAVCDRISKSSQKKSCQREVELTP